MGHNCEIPTRDSKIQARKQGLCEWEKDRETQNDTYSAVNEGRKKKTKKEKIIIIRKRRDKRSGEKTRRDDNVIHSTNPNEKNLPP